MERVYKGVCPQCGRKYSRTTKPKSAIFACKKCGHDVQVKVEKASRTPGSSSEHKKRKEKAKPKELSSSEKWAQEQAAARALMLKVASGILVVCLMIVAGVVVSLKRSAAEAKRQETIANLAKGTGDGATPIPLLLETIENESQEAKRGAVASFEKMGASASEAVPQLIKLLDHESESVKVYTLRALAGIGESAKSAVKPVEKTLLDSKSTKVKAAAIGALRMWQTPEEIVPLLVPLVGSSDRSLQEEAVAGLAGAGPEAKAAVPELLVLIRQGGEKLAKNSARAVGSIDPENPDVFRALELTLKNSSKSWEIRRGAAEGLGYCGEKAIPLLKESIESPSLISASSHALAQTGDPAAIPILVRTLNRLDEIEVQERRGISVPRNYVVTKSTSNALGEVLSERKYRVGSYEAQQRAISKGIDGARGERDKREHAIRQALAKLGVIGDDGVKAAMEKVDREVLGWDPELWSQSKELIVPEEQRLSHLCWSPNGKLLMGVKGERFIGGDANRLFLWDIDNSKLKYDFSVQTPDEELETFAFSSDSQLLAAGGRGKKIYVWSLEDGKLLHELVIGSRRGIFGSISALKFLDAKTLGSISSDANFRKWNLEDGKLISTEDYSGGRTYAQFSEDGKVLALAGTTGSGNVTKGGRVTDFATGKVLYNYTGRPKAMSHNGMWLAETSSYSTDRGAIEIHSVQARKEVTAVKVPRDSRTHDLDMPTAIAFNPEGTIMVNGGIRGTVRFWQSEEGRELMVRKLHARPVTAIAFSYDGSHLASTSLDSKIQILSQEKQVASE